MISIIRVGMALTVSCSHTEEPDAADPPVECTPADTVTSVLHISKDADWGGTGTLDILLYEDDGLRMLEEHMTADCNGGEITVHSTAGRKICVVVANSTKDLDMKIMERFDTMQSLVFEYKDEDPGSPVMVAVAGLEAGEKAEIILVPFLCRVMIDEVSNAMDDWTLMEDPEVFLSGINPEVSILQEKDFRPAATFEEGPYAALPCDIGFFSQHPGTVLHCYPNETPERILGGFRTALTFRCRVRGEMVEETVALPPAGRNSLIKVKVSMSEDARLSFSF